MTIILLLYASYTKIMLVTNWQKRLSLPADQQKLNIQMDSWYFPNVESEKTIAITINYSLQQLSHHHQYYICRFIAIKTMFIRFRKGWIKVSPCKRSEIRMHDSLNTLSLHLSFTNMFRLTICFINYCGIKLNKTTHMIMKC